jgi:dolichyl-diphosphooligosaccharide--protein glycosyltransferase
MTLGKLFIGMYGVLATYFSCVMIRLMLVLAPAACIIAAIAISEILRKATKVLRVYMTYKASEDDNQADEIEEKPEEKDDKV